MSVRKIPSVSYKRLDATVTLHHCLDRAGYVEVVVVVPTWCGDAAEGRKLLDPQLSGQRQAAQVDELILAVKDAAKQV